MSVFLNNVSELLDSGDITKSQALYLIFLNDEIIYPIDDKELLELVANKYVLNNKVTKRLTTKSKSKATSSLTAIFENDISKGVYVHLCKKFCNKNPDTGFIQLPEGEDDLTFTADEYLNKEIEIAPMFWVMLFMFPVRGETNKRWEKAFINNFYTGIPLRRRSKEAGSRFVTMARKYDMGAFLLGLYRYIKDNVKGDQAYITTIPKYLKTHMEYTRQALIDIKRAKTVAELFKDRATNNGVKNVVL